LLFLVLKGLENMLLVAAEGRPLWCPISMMPALVVFREAAQQKAKRIIVFAVSGTIHLESPLQIEGNVTIAGQSAPGEGICIADHPVRLKGDQIILRYMRFRMGDRYQSQKGMVDGSGGDDALSGSKNNQLIIDHCSMSWSTDEVMSVYGGDSTTLQWNMIAEPLNYSYHFETGDKDWENHGYGGIWGGAHLSAHHNLFAHCISRNPRFNGARLGAKEELVDFQNNVVVQLAKQGHLWWRIRQVQYCQQLFQARAIHQALCCRQFPGSVED